MEPLLSWRIKSVGSNQTKTKWGLDEYSTALLRKIKLHNMLHMNIKTKTN